MISCGILTPAIYVQRRLGCPWRQTVNGKQRGEADPTGPLVRSLSVISLTISIKPEHAALLCTAVQTDGLGNSEGASSL